MINKSLNDCADFSFGKYKIINSKLSNCGDKGISVGEKSHADFDKVEILNSDIGIASKDSSITKLKNVYLKNLKTCISA